MFFFISASVILFLIIIISLQVYKSSKRKKLIKKAQEDYNNTLNELGKTQNKIFQKIEKIYGVEKAHKVAEGKIWIDMPVLLLIIAVGRADKITENISRKRKIEKWYYGGYQTNRGTHKYQVEVTLEDDIVSGWKDLY